MGKKKVEKFDWEDFSRQVLDNSHKKWPRFDEVYYSLAMCNEAGECAGYIKKRKRGDSKRPTDKQVGKEIADTIMYGILLADCMGLDLPKALSGKLKEVQKRKPKTKKAK